MIKINVREYLKEFGPVTDKEYAIRLLCETSEAFDVLDPSLQADPEVFLFYQPNGYLVTQTEEDCGVIVTSTFFNIDGRFGNPIHGKEYNKYARYGDVVPGVGFPEGIDYNRYFEIQRLVRGGSRPATPEEAAILSTLYYYQIGSSVDDYYHRPDESGYFMYNREILKELASEVLGTRQP